MKLFNPKPGRAEESSKWHRDRLESVRDSLVGESGIFTDYPYIEEGVYHWTGIKSAVKLDLVFSEIPLAVVVAQRYYNPDFDKIKNMAPDRGTWESYMRTESEKILACRAAGFPLLFITPDNPVDIYSLSLQIEAVVNPVGGNEYEE